VIVFISIREESGALIMKNTHILISLEELTGTVSLRTFSIVSYLQAEGISVHELWRFLKRRQSPL
jgi:hypothetical protein